jgi:hypothetical protein
MTNNMNLYNFNTKGFEVFERKNYVNLVDLKSLEWNFPGTDNDFHPTGNTKDLDKALMIIHTSISNEIVTPLFGEHIIGDRQMWEGIYDKASFWHNDIEECDFFFILYFSEMKKYNEGEIEFKTDKEQYKIYPSPGTLILVNNNIKFQHRAGKTNKRRIQASFYFNLNNER